MMMLPSRNPRMRSSNCRPSGAESARSFPPAFSGPPLAGSPCFAVAAGPGGRASLSALATIGACLGWRPGLDRDHFRFGRGPLEPGFGFDVGHDAFFVDELQAGV